MKLVIKGSPAEVAALILAVQERQHSGMAITPITLDGTAISRQMKGLSDWVDAANQRARRDTCAESQK